MDQKQNNIIKDCHLLITQNLNSLISLPEIMPGIEINNETISFFGIYLKLLKLQKLLKSNIDICSLVICENNLIQLQSSVKSISQILSDTEKEIRTIKSLGILKSKKKEIEEIKNNLKSSIVINKEIKKKFGNVKKEKMKKKK